MKSGVFGFPSNPRDGLISDAAEQALLGAMLIDNRAWLRVSESLRTEHFGNAVHGRIFAAIGKIVERGGTANPITLGAAFESDDALTDMGGRKYLARLANEAVTIMNAGEYARIITDLWRRRTLISTCGDTIADASVVDLARSADVIVEEHEKRLTEIAAGGEARGPVTLGDAAAKAIAACEAAYKRGDGLTGLSTGLRDLDHALGGLVAGDLIVIGARPGMGKTALAIDIAEAVASSGHAVGFFSLEMPDDQLGQRSLAHASGVPVLRQARGDLDSVHWGRLADAANALQRLPIHIDDTGGLSIAQIRARARRWARRHQIKLVVIDHLQLIREGGHSDNRRLEIDQITNALKALAKELSLPVLLLSQLNRSVESRADKRPSLADLRESGSIEQDADRVLLLYRPEYYLRRERPDSDDHDAVAHWEQRCEAARGVALLIVAKNRHGPDGEVWLHWDSVLMQFRSLRQ